MENLLVKCFINFLHNIVKSSFSFRFQKLGLFDIGIVNGMDIYRKENETR